MSRTIALVVATVVVAIGAGLIFVRDLSNDSRGMRSIVEAAIPLTALVVLLWSAWALL